MEWWIVLIILIAVVIGLVSWFISVYNKVLNLQHRVKNAWSQIEVQLQRRFDLIPNIVNTVKGYATHEKETLESVILARNQFANAKNSSDQIEADNQLSSALSRLMVVVEKYPELKADVNFSRLQSELSETEDKVAISRQIYNDTTTKYNFTIKKIPEVFVANAMGFKEEPLFKSQEGAASAPKVEF